MWQKKFASTFNQYVSNCLEKHAEKHEQFGL